MMKTFLRLPLLAAASAMTLLAVGCTSNSDHSYGLTGDVSGQSANQRFIGNNPHGQPLMISPDRVGTSSGEFGPGQTPGFRGLGPHGQPL